MKSFLLPLLVVLLSTGLTTWCCQLSGMPRHDLWIAASVAFSVGACVAATTVAIAAGRGPRASGASHRR